MPSKSDSAEGIILNFINEQNRPLNVQIVADTLQKHGIKKAAAQKILDGLAEAGKITFKEYGKQKIYLAKQDQFSVLSKEELEQMKKQVNELQEALSGEKKAISELEGEIRSMGTNMKLEEIKERISKLSEEITAMEERVTTLRAGTVLITAEERARIEGEYNKKIGLWRKRKRIFKELWDTITESLPRKESELKEEIGVETDEDLGINIQSYCSYGIKKQRVK